MNRPDDSDRFHEEITSEQEAKESTNARVRVPASTKEQSMSIIRKAERRKAKLRLGISAPSGSGKTYGALQLAFGLGGKVGLVDTEHGSGDLYAHLGDYDIVNITAPYTVPKYLEAVKAFEDAGYSTIILDSISHAWAGEGGLLDKQGKIADSSRSGNSYTAWRQITPEHNALVEAMLKSPCHIIATMRAKQEYVQEKGDNGKTVIRKVGLAPVQREGMEYEFTVMLDISMEHIASTSKDRTGLFDGQFFKLSKDTGIKLLGWLETGSEVAENEKQEALTLLKESDSIDALKLNYERALVVAHRYPEFKDVAVRAKDARKAELTPKEKA